MNQIDKGEMCLRLRNQDVANMKKGNHIIYDREWLPFKIRLMWLDVEDDN